MTGLSWVIQADPARWQRRAAAGLDVLLDAYPGRAAIAWTGGPAGCVLAGRVPGLAPAGHVRDVFDAGRAAAALEEHRGHQSCGAAARRDLVRAWLTATVPAGVQEDQ